MGKCPLASHALQALSMYMVVVKQRTVFSPLPVVFDLRVQIEVGSEGSQRNKSDFGDSDSDTGERTSEWEHVNLPHIKLDSAVYGGVAGRAGGRVERAIGHVHVLRGREEVRVEECGHPKMIVRVSTSSTEPNIKCTGEKRDEAERQRRKPIVLWCDSGGVGEE